MKTQTDTTQEQQNIPVQRVQQEASNGGTTQLVDNRESTSVQRKLQDSMSAATENTTNLIQRKNNTGLPDNLKSGIENLSGYSMDDVKVHYNSSKPAQLLAHAYAQGTDIHLASGQEKYLPHEAWHVVQQKQGRVKPIRQLKSKVSINDDARLEREADVMGERATQVIPTTVVEPTQLKIKRLIGSNSVQRYKTKEKGLTVAGEFHNKNEKQRLLENKFVKSVKGSTAEVWTENEMPNNLEVYKASETPDDLLLSGIDRIKYYSAKLMQELSRKDSTILASGIAISTSIKALNDAFGTISTDVSNAFNEKTFEDDNDPYLALQTLKSNVFSRTIVLSDPEELDNVEKKKISENYQSFLRDLEKFDQSVSTIINIPQGREISHNFIRSRAMHELANKNHEVNGVWLIGQYHIQEIQEQLRDSIEYDLVSMIDFNNDIRDFINREGNDVLLNCNLNNRVGEVSVSARIIKSSLHFFSSFNEQWNSGKIQYKEEEINFNVQRLIEHIHFLNGINQNDLININLSIDDEKKSKIIHEILLIIQTLKKELATVPLLNFINDFSPKEKQPKFLTLILKLLNKKSIHSKISDLEILATISK